MRNQSIAGSKLPDLSEAAEQERGNSCCFPPRSHVRQKVLSAVHSAMLPRVCTS